MIALFVALGVGLIALQPWAPTSLAPQVGVNPALGPDVGDAVAVAPGSTLAIAPAQPAVLPATVLAARPVVATEGDGAEQLGVAAAQVVASPAGGSPQQGPPGTSPQPAAPESAPVSVPVAAPPAAAPAPAGEPPTGTPPASGGNPPGPVVSGPILPEPQPVEISAGGEYAFSLPVRVQPQAFRAPGGENVILRFKGADAEDPTFALQLWDDGAGERGLWSSGAAMEGERFLAPLAEGVWHQLVLFFGASSEEDGSYSLLLDGDEIDARAGVSLLDEGSASTWLEPGLFRDGERVSGSQEVAFGPTAIIATGEPALP